MSAQILISRADGVCEVRFNRPEKRNAITFAMYEALYRGLREAQADAAVRVVLLGGEGAGFCAGNDLNDFLTGPPFSAEHPVLGFLHTLATFEKPLLAAIHGQTVGIGVTLLLHCDLVVAARTAQLSMPFVSLGLVPEAASSLLLPRLVGQQRAAELLFLLSEARALARAVAQQPNGALLATRRLLRGDPEQVRARIEAEARIFGAQLQSEEFRAAVRAFLAKGRAG
jgi:enoyl-CoA hydratase/carnithine racemase